MSYGPEELAYIATVISSAAAAWDWSAGLDSKQAVMIEEVHCMQIDSEDKVCIACNSNKHQRILNSYKVTVKTPSDGGVVDARTWANEAENATLPTNKTLSKLSGAPAAQPGTGATSER